jgi:hypothetical protein
VDDVGEVTDDHQIMTISEQTPTGIHKRAVRILKSDVPADMQVGVPYTPRTP